MAGFIWWSMCIGIATICLWAVAGDVYLWQQGRPLITEYLRQHPWSFWWSALTLVIGVTVLALHLFVQASNGAGGRP